MEQQSLDTVVGFRPVAVIFDMDGVLAETEPRNEQALATVLARRGARMTEDEYRGLVGQSNETSWAWMIRRFGLTDATADLQDAYLREVLPLLSTVPPSPGVGALVGDLRAVGIRLAVASSSPRPAGVSSSKTRLTASKLRGERGCARSRSEPATRPVRRFGRTSSSIRSRSLWHRSSRVPRTLSCGRDEGARARVAPDPLEDV